MSRDLDRPPGTSWPRRRWRPRPRLDWSLAMCLAVVWPVTTVLYDLRLRHAERIPATGGVLLVANHVSVLDPLSCAMLVYDAGRVPRFLAKHAVFKGLAGTILRSAGQIPVYRGTSAAQSSMSAAEQALADGEVVIIYPEGSVTRDPDWWPMEPRSGAARLALASDAVVVPLAQWGPQRVHDYHEKKLHLRLRTRADYLVGEPVDLDDLRAQVRAGRPVTAALLHETTDRLMGRVRAQLGEVRGEQPPRAVHPRPGRTPGDLPGAAGAA
ncbi:lysophospholipid acyltransferase family protein [Klenkia sp. LSe6-5]|uniref:Lysophospholipid acyltransferase family protein n=1 Tax=Klenkia sesuvii TaxID=3103137 RepID=A0ABU8DVS9_9ACTN